MTENPEKFDVVVVGAGPAGLAAAEAAAATGLSVAVVDLYPQPGGQYGMAAGPTFPALADSPAAKGARQAARRVEAAGVRFFGEAELFAVEKGFRLGLATAGRSLVLRADAVIAATGAHEIVYPFPGWTLPGVVTAGAAQRLLKGSGVSPGRSVVLAGNGPFLYAVAQSFALAEQRLRAVVDAGQGARAAARSLIAFPDRLLEGMRLWRDTRSIADRLIPRQAVVEALGERQVEAIRIAPIVDGRFDHGRSELIDGIDALCIGHGFAPVIDLTASLGARHAYDEDKGGWFCLTDPDTGATSVAGLFAAGETTGLGGALPAALSGELAGWGAAALLGRSVPTSWLRNAGTRLRRARRFAQALSELWSMPKALKSLAKPDTCICRCEDVPRSALDAALDEGAADLGQAKLWTRAGMGLCQGRFCGPYLREQLAARLDRPPQTLGFNPPRFPLRPVPAAVGLAWSRDDDAIEEGAPVAHDQS